MAMASPLAAAALLFLVLGTHLASCEDPRSRRSPVIRRAQDEPTTGCYVVAMEDDASEEELQQVAAKAVKASDDGRLHGLVKRLKRAFTVKLNNYALEMVREGGIRGSDSRVESDNRYFINLYNLFTRCDIYPEWSILKRKDL